MRKSTMIPLVIAVLILVPFAYRVAQAQLDLEFLHERATIWFRPIPQEPPGIPGKRLTPEKIELGRTLFFDRRLSANHEMSCNDCHTLALGGAGQRVELGHLGQPGPRTVPTLLNAVFNTAHFWDGRAEDLAEPEMGPIETALKKRSTPEHVVATLSSMPDYRALFQDAFPEEEDPLTFDTVILALETFLATLITPDSRFDQYLRGDRDALDQVELEGLDSFITAGCVNCHHGRNLGGRSYHPFGVTEAPPLPLRPAEDIGRAVVTDLTAHNYFFKSPTLRNIELTPPYFHSGIVWSLRGATAVMGSVQMRDPLGAADADRITEFLRTLTGDLPDPTPPLLPASTDATPEPTEMP